MSVRSVTYEAFQTANQAFVADGGVWLPSVDSTPQQDPGTFSSPQIDYCDGYCLKCMISGHTGGSPTFTTINYTTNIAVDMSQYGATTALDFTWTYWPTYTANEGTEHPLTMGFRSQVNELTFDNITLSRDTTVFNTDHIWAGSPISHSGTTSVNRSGDLAFIAISINHTTIPQSDLTIVTYVKGIDFKLTTPIQSVSSVASSSGSLMSATSSTAASGSLTLPSVTFPPDFTAGSPSLGPLPTSSSQLSQASKISTAALGGIAAGIVVLIAALVIALVLYRRRKRSSEEYEPSPAIYPYKKPGRHSSPTFLSRSNNNHGFAAPTSISQHHQQRTRPGPSSERMQISPSNMSGIQGGAASTGIYDPPPAYNDEEFPP